MGRADWSGAVCHQRRPVTKEHNAASVCVCCRKSHGAVAWLPYRHWTKGKDMSRRALVFLQKRGTEGESYLGPKLIDPTPSLGSRVAFIHEGRTLAGQVGSIQPPAWSKDSEIIPTIHVIRD